MSVNNIATTMEIRAGRIDMAELHELNAEVRALISVRTKRAELAPTDILDAMVAASAEHFGIEPKPDDPGTPEVRRCMESVLARLRADGVIR